MQIYQPLSSNVELHMNVKLDGVAPLMTDPPPISSTTLSEKKKKKNDMWHVTRDTWHVTRDTFGGVNILSKFQLSSFYRIWFMILWRYYRKRMSDLINQWITRLFVGQPRLHRVCQRDRYKTSHIPPRHIWVSEDNRGD